jgi:cystathionine beta-lyase family protein involved in aluminum resistance
MDGLHGQASKVMSNLLRAERKAKTALQTELTEANETAKEATEKLVEAQAKLAKVNAFLASSGIAFDDTASSA